MKKITILFLFTLFNLTVSAQKYRTAVGARLGKENFGLSIQQKVMERNTLEGIFSAGSDQVVGTLLFERHFPILGKGFNYYLGGGAHVGKLKNEGTLYGGDLILGTELKVPIFPLVISLDVQPAIHANHPQKWFDVGGGFTLRYILIKEKKENRGLRGIFGGNQDDSRNKKSRKNKKEEAPRKGNIFGW